MNISGEKSARDWGWYAAGLWVIEDVRGMGGRVVVGHAMSCKASLLSGNWTILQTFYQDIQALGQFGESRPPLLLGDFWAPMQCIAPVIHPNHLHQMLHNSLFCQKLKVVKSVFHIKNGGIVRLINGLVINDVQSSKV